ncbi:restriction endonuclease subunit S [Peptoniphilaceae bacterium SGI.137]
MKCIEDEIPFELPDGWAWARLGNIGEWKAGATPNRKCLEYYNGDIPWVKTGDLNDDYIKEIPETITKKALKETSVSIIPKDTVLIAMYGATIGKLGITTCDVTTNQACCACCNLKGVNKKFLFYFLMQHKSNFISMGFGGAQPNISKEKIVQVIIPIPPIEEQNKITAKLTELFTFVKKIESAKSTLQSTIQQTKSKILDLAIRGKLVPQDPNDEPASVLMERIRAEKEELIQQGKIKRDKKESVIFKGDDNSYYEKMSTGEVKCIDDELPFVLPEGWEWCNLSMIGTTNIGLTYRPTDIEGDGTIVLRSNNIINDKINLNDVVRVTAKIRENQYVKANDILICTRNGSKALVGKCAIIGDLNEPASFGAFMAIYRTDYYKYVLHYLRSNLFRIVFDDGNSTAINQLTQDMLKRARIPLPPLAEQERIVDTIDKLLSNLQAIEKSLS